MKIFLKNNKGSALITSILVFAVLIILGTSLLSVSYADTTFASHQSNKIQAHYLGRSGVNIGLKILNNELTSTTYNDLDVLTTALNNDAATLLNPPSDPDNDPNSYKVGNAGSFNLSFQRYDTRGIKIISEGIVNGTSQTTETVTLTVKTKLPTQMYNNPGEWVTGINLNKGINPNLSGSYLGKGILLEGHPVQSPKGSNNPSTFQASIIYFTDYNGISLRQINNSTPITFDAEIIYFTSGVTFNNTDDDIKLSVSNVVLENKVDPLQYSIISDPDAGFENYDRYVKFTQGFNINGYKTTYYFKNPSGPPNSYDTYTFKSGVKYGIVYFGDNVTNYDGSLVNYPGSSASSNSGYYFFPNGVSIKDPTSYKDLIPIKSDDAIINALQGMFKLTVSTEPYQWNNN